MFGRPVWRGCLALALVGICTVPAGGPAQATTLFTAHINFQPCAAPVPPGYSADCGYAFDATRGYGWSKDIRANTRWRHLINDERYDTIILPGTATWKIQVPAAGTYRVGVAVGDPTGNGVSSVTVNGHALITEFHSTLHTPFDAQHLDIAMSGPGFIQLSDANETRSHWDYLIILQIS